MEIDGPVSPGRKTNVFPKAETRDRRRRVLVVDDDPDMRALLEEALGDEGYLVTGASDTLSAMIHLLGHDVDVVVLDWKMPGQDGLALLGSVRRILPRLPVILITAYNQPDVHRRALENGAFGFLAKPFPVRLLLAEIQGALVGASRAGPASSANPSPE